MISLALRLQVVSQAPQHLRSPETQAGMCDGYFAYKYIRFSVISLESGMSGTEYPHESLKVDTELGHIMVICQAGLPIKLSIHFICSNLIECVRRVV